MCLGKQDFGQVFGLVPTEARLAKARRGGLALATGRWPYLDGRGEIEPLEGAVDIGKCKQPVTRPVLQALVERLVDDDSGYERRVALGHIILGLLPLTGVLDSHRREQRVALPKRRRIGREGRQIA